MNQIKSTTMDLKRSTLILFFMKMNVNLFNISCIQISQFLFVSLLLFFELNIWIYNLFDIHYLLNVTYCQISATGIIFIFISALNCLLLFVKRIFSKIYGLWKWGEQPFILIHEELEMGTCWPLKRIKIGQALLTISYFLQTKEKKFNEYQNWW